MTHVSLVRSALATMVRRGPRIELAVLAVAAQLCVLPLAGCGSESAAPPAATPAHGAHHPALIRAPGERAAEPPRTVAPAEAACLRAGGHVETRNMCGELTDFFDACSADLLYASGCAPDNSHEVRFCVCPNDYHCFDGTRCRNRD